MKYIKLFKTFISEALRDEIPSHVSDILKKRYPEKYLDMDVPKHTDLIPNIKVEVKNDNITNKTINEIIDYFLENINIQYEKSEMFKLLQKHKFSILVDKSLNNTDSHMNDFIDNMKKLYSKEFRLLDSKSTQDNIIFSNNKSNIYGFIKSYNRVFNNEIVYDIDKDKQFNGLRDVVLNYDKNIEEIKNAKLYLYITDKPTDKLLMSVSRFYDSCQNIYTGGEQGTQYNKKLLSNVFDVNSKVALLIFDTPYTDKKGSVIPYTSIARTIIRASDDKIMFDKTYPNDMQNVMYSIITEYTGLKNQGKAKDVYHYKNVSGLPQPYMDKYKLDTTYGEDDEPENGYAEAFITYFGVSMDDIEVEYDRDIRFEDSLYRVFTYSEVMEEVRDYFRDSSNFFEEEGKNSMANALRLKWLNFDIMINVFNRNSNKKFKKEEDDTISQNIENFIVFLEDNGIETIEDFVDLDRNYKYPIPIDVDNYVDEDGGDDEWLSMLRKKAQSPEDGEEHEQEIGDIRYFIYKIE